ncbi:MAG: hypothetical protein ACKVS9_19875, partial [Phycisphaerae bacterium]
MKTRFQFVVALTASLWTASLSLAQTPLETAIAYQGYLTNNGAPIVGPTNQLMTFRLFDVPLGGTALSTLSNIPVTIEDSLFTVPLNFATNLWDGNDRWIEVQIGTQVLVPRQKLRPVPYALYALNATPGTCAPWDCSGADVFNTNTGGVGVGTSAPERKLHVFAGSAGTVTANSGADLVVEDDSSTYINLLSPTTLDSAVLFGTPTNAADGGVLYNIAGDRSMYFRTGGNTTRAIISATGNFGIGTTTPA